MECLNGRARLGVTETIVSLPLTLSFKSQSSSMETHLSSKISSALPCASPAFVVEHNAPLLGERAANGTVS